MSFATFAMTVLLSTATSGANQQAGYNQHASAAQPGWGMTRRDNPHSTVVGDDNAPVHYPTNDELNAAETGNPESTDFRYSNIASSEPVSQAALDALEDENPHSAQPPKHAAVAVANTNAPDTGNPASTEVRYASTGGFASEPGFVLDAESPDNARPPKGTAAAVASAAPAAACICMASHEFHGTAGGHR